MAQADLAPRHLPVRGVRSRACGVRPRLFQTLNLSRDRLRSDGPREAGVRRPDPAASRELRRYERKTATSREVDAAVSVWPQHPWEDGRRPVRRSGHWEERAVASNSLQNPSLNLMVPLFYLKVPTTSKGGGGRRRFLRSARSPREERRPGSSRPPWEERSRELGAAVSLGRRSHRRVPRAAFWEDRRHGYLFTCRRQPHERSSRSSTG